MINVYEQQFTEEDAQAAYDAVKTGILSSFGMYVSELEDCFAKYTARKYSLACCNGTAGLVLALYGLNICRERVAVPACSFAATGFAALEQQNVLEFIDADRKTWNLDLDDLERKCAYWAPRGPIKCVIAVHTYGNPYDYDRLKAMSIKYGFKIIEDACEALGAEYKGRKAGNMGDVSVFSFYGNKLIAGGEGGLVLTDDPAAADRMKLYRGQGQDPHRRFWHLIPAFNYRITNLQAAVIVSQFKRLKAIRAQKAMVRAAYNRWLPTDLKQQGVVVGATHSWWMISVLSDEPAFYERMRDKLSHAGVETRPIFPPLPRMPAFLGPHGKTPNAEYLNEHGISVPSGPATKEEDIQLVCDLLR